MSVAVVATVAPTDLPEDLRAHAKSIADRKVMRFLDSVSLPAFVAACLLLDGRHEVEPSRRALFTVSGWEANVVAPNGESASRERLVKHYLEESNPTDWLRAMPNNALCQIAIVTGLRGPNAHLVGGGTALFHALTVASQTIERGAADLAVLVAFDELDGDGQPATGAGIALARDGGPTLEIEDAALAGPATATGAMMATIAALRSLDGDRARASVSFAGALAARAVAQVHA